MPACRPSAVRRAWRRSGSAKTVPKLTSTTPKARARRSVRATHSSAAPVPANAARNSRWNHGGKACGYGDRRAPLRRAPQRERADDLERRQQQEKRHGPPALSAS